MEDMLFWANICQLSTIILSLVGYIPQWILLISSQSAHNVSLNSWVVWLLSSLLSWIYAIAHYYSNMQGAELLITSSLSVLFVTVTIGLILYFKRLQVLRSLEEQVNSK